MSFSKKNSFCSSRYSSTIEAIRITPLKFISQLPIISENFQIKYKEQKNKRVKKCSLANDQIVDNMTDWIYKNEPEFKNYPLIFHDVYFHHVRSKYELYPKVDKIYLSNIMKLTRILKENKLIDNIILLSDHGPRISKYNEKIRMNKTLNELDQKGFFIYYLPLKETNNDYIIAIEKKLNIKSFKE